ncbi:MAG: kinase/pyrophosphorylase [Gammaproteobacteria bacterium]|jgi:regulator of PEP synthase PpsR (kinase-PPPase family)
MSPADAQPASRGAPAVRPVFLVSEGTGITAEELAHSLLAQFTGVRFDVQYVPFVNTLDKADEVVDVIRQAQLLAGVRPIVFATLVDETISARVRSAPCLYLEVFDRFLGSLSDELGVLPLRKIGLSHSLGDSQTYDRRYDTINFALTNDDGERLDRFSDADVILVGVSRCGKTPACLYLAMHYGMRAANYPLTDEDFVRGDVPAQLAQARDRIVALTIDPARLHHVRQARRPNSEYASLDRCRRELREADVIFRRLDVPVLDATSHSIEELASLIHKMR